MVSQTPANARSAVPPAGAMQQGSSSSSSSSSSSNVNLYTAVAPTPSRAPTASGLASSSGFKAPATASPAKATTSTPRAANARLGGPAEGAASPGGSTSDPSGDRTRRDSDAAGSKEEVKGRPLSCTECKRRKIKCDRACPCGPCVLRNDQERCKQVIKWEAGCSLSEFQLLQTRVKDLESRLDSFERSGPPLNIPPPPGAVPAHTINPPVSASSARGGARDRADDDAALMLEDYAMGNRANAAHAAAILGADPTRTASGLPLGLGAAELGDNAVTQRSADPAIDVAMRFLSLCPAPNIVQAMSTYYFDRLEWYTKCLHRPSYEAEAERMRPMTPEVAARSIRPAFICIHLMIICLALHLCGPEDVHDWGLDRPQAAQLCDAMFAGAQQLLWASDFIGSHQVEHLQAVILMSVYAYNLDDSDAAYALVGASIKIAQNLRLNRLDDARTPAGGRAQAQGGAGTHLGSTLDREIARRVWYYLMWLDYSHSMAHGCCYSIHPSHNRTLEPPNINDEDLTTSGPVVPRPMNEYTTTSFTIYRLRFLMLYREIIDLHNQPRGPTYAQVLEMDKKLSSLMSSLPQMFHLRIDDRDSWPQGDSNRDLELLSIQLTAWNRLLRLHRPWLLRGLKNPKDQCNLSARRCIEAGTAILCIMRHAKVTAPMLLKVWINVYYGFGGAIVMFVALCYEADQSGLAAEEKRAAVREMADIASTASHLSAGAKNTGNLLRGLLDAELEIRLSGQPNGSGKTKRKRGGQDDTDKGPFDRLVSRVLLDATTHTSSSSVTALNRSPSEGGLSFEPPHKRHGTSISYARGGGSEDHVPTTHNPYGASGSFAAPQSPWGGSSASSGQGPASAHGSGIPGWGAPPGLAGGAMGASAPGQTPPFSQAGQGLTSLLDDDLWSNDLWSTLFPVRDMDNTNNGNTN